MDRITAADDIRRLRAVPDVVVGSVHAVTENGSLTVLLPWRLGDRFALLAMAVTREPFGVLVAGS